MNFIVNHLDPEFIPTQPEIVPQRLLSADYLIVDLSKSVSLAFIVSILGEHLGYEGCFIPDKSRVKA